MSKSDSKDPLVRNLVLLGLVPRYPRSISVQELKAALASRGFSVSSRTLQRDLAEKLAVRFPLICQEEGLTFRWSFDGRAQINLPASDTATALAMTLAEEQLKHILPPDVLTLLVPQFDDARRQLGALETNTLASWARRVRSIPSGKALLPAQVDAGVWDCVARALLERRQLSVNYRGRGRDVARPMVVHPQGLVSRGAVSYLIANVAGYEDLRHFSLHRIQSAEVLEDSADSEDFDIDDYVANAAWTPRSGPGSFTLLADVEPQLARTLTETPLCQDQDLFRLGDSGWFRLKATVRDDHETFWWVFGLGPNIRVHEPGIWVEQIRKRLDAMREYYEPGVAVATSMRGARHEQ